MSSENLPRAETSGTGFSSDNFNKQTNNYTRHHPLDIIFGDGCCGEPMTAQHLVIDFTPAEEDTDYVQKKCCAFWDFVNSQPELQHLMVLPNSKIYRKSHDTSDSPSDPGLMETAESVVHERTAVSMLEIVEGKGLIDRTFEAKLPQSQCSLGSREYRENEVPLPPARPTSLKVCVCSGTCKACSRQRSSNLSAAASSDVVDLCRKMDEWDSEHPKCMDPPGHPPALTRCVMQRRKMSP